MLKVLVVEDEPLILSAAIEMFQEAGAEVLSATSAVKAWTLFNAHPDIGLVFSDVRMPGELDGFGLAEALRGIRPSIPIVLTSGHTVEGRGFELLRKPYREHEIQALVKRYAAPTAAKLAG